MIEKKLIENYIGQSQLSNRKLTPQFTKRRKERLAKMFKKSLLAFLNCT